MLNTSKFFFIGLATLIGSIALAMMWNLFLFPQPTTRKPQSNAEVRSALQKIEALNESYQTTDCPCNFEQFNPRLFEAESPLSCRSERLSHHNRLEANLKSYSQTRAQGSFPRACLTYIMNTFGPKNTRSSLFASCSGSNLRPTRRSFKPCVSDSYINVTYNAFNDVATCLGINPKYLIPKIANESGFHTNAFGAGSDTGIGQLTGPAIQDVNRHVNRYKGYVTGSNRASCKRLSPLIINQKPVPHQVGARCSLMQSPQNPTLNMFYMAIKFQLDFATIDRFYQRRGIETLIKQAGLQSVDREKIRTLLLTLAYNTGAGGAINHIREYLNYRIALRAKGIRPLTAQDFDISGFSTKVNRQKAPLTFGEYLTLNQRVGTKGYLSKLKSKSEELDRAFKPGVCSVRNYLQVSTGRGS